jgi:hypothetical protein
VADSQTAAVACTEVVQALIARATDPGETVMRTSAEATNGLPGTFDAAVVFPLSAYSPSIFVTSVVRIQHECCRRAGGGAWHDAANRHEISRLVPSGHDQFFLSTTSKGGGSF